MNLTESVNPALSPNPNPLFSFSFPNLDKHGRVGVSTSEEMVRTRSNISTTPRRAPRRRSVSESEVIILESPRPKPNNGRVISADAESLVAPVSNLVMALLSSCKETGCPKETNDTGRRFNRQLFGWSFGLKKGLRFRFYSETCLNYQFLNSFLVKGISSQNSSHLFLKPTLKPTLFLLNWALDLEGPTSSAKLHAEAQDRKEKMEKNLQCAVCMSLPFCNIYQCKRGHLICMDCHSKMPKPISCPSCRTPMPATPIRSRAAEQVRTITISKPKSSLLTH